MWVEIIGGTPIVTVEPFLFATLDIQVVLIIETRSLKFQKCVLQSEHTSENLMTLRVIMGCVTHPKMRCRHARKNITG
jgi:hypothetical protein